MDERKTFVVEDDRGYTHVLSGKSWEGGQGVVTVDATGKFIVKVIRFRKEDGSAARERVRRQIRQVRVMPLQDLPVAMPLALLNPPYVGYVMQYLKGMQVLEKLVDPPASVVSGQESPTDWYVQTGGLKRRLWLLARLAGVLKRLHSKGLVYGDLSPKNVLISESYKHSEVYLIDLDNLCYDSSKPESFIHTDNFCAPEVYTHRHGIDSLTDAYSFAVLAFWVLELKHPFEGELVDQGEPELMWKAINAGEMPWIFHSSDDRNSSEHVLPKENILSKNIFNQFKQTFEDGLINRRARPTLSMWEAALHTASRNMIICPTCRASYYYRERACPYCDASRPHFLLARTYDYNPDAEKPENQERLITGACMQYPGKFVITRRFLGYNDDEADLSVLELEIDERLTARARLLSTRECCAAPENKSQEIEIGPNWEKMPFTYWIHIGPIDQIHPLIKFERV